MPPYQGSHIIRFPTFFQDFCILEVPRTGFLKKIEILRGKIDVYVKYDLQKSSCTDFHKAGGFLRDQSRYSWFFGAPRPSREAEDYNVSEIPRLRPEQVQQDSKT
jgi:hypothetical protein